MCCPVKIIVHLQESNTHLEGLHKSILDILQNDEFEKYPLPTCFRLDLLVEFQDKADKAVKKLVMIQIL